MAQNELLTSLIPERLTIEPCIVYDLDSRLELSILGPCQRSEIPLAFTTGCHDPQPRPFRSDSLSPDLSVQCLNNGIVLIGKLKSPGETSKSLFVMEPLTRYIWIISRLAKTLRLKDVKQWTKKECLLPCKHNIPVHNHDGMYNPDAEVRRWRFEGEKSSHPPSRATIPLQMTPPTLTDKSEQSLNQMDGHHKSTRGGGDRVSKSREPEVEVYLRNRYFESLYGARSPLAHFAKSTLSKARILCTSNDRNFEHLVKILSGLVGSLAKTDEKYKTVIPQIVSQLGENSKSGTDDINLSSQETKYIYRWWSNTRSQDQQPDKIIQELRVRETQLHIIILLEIMSLKVDDGKGRKSTTSSSQKSNKNEHKGQLKPEVMVDVLFDRLCIWQAVNISFADTKNEVKDANKEFCREIILPFFRSRLPQKTEALYGKCRGHDNSHHFSASAQRRNNPVQSRPGTSISKGSQTPDTPEPDRDINKSLVQQNEGGYLHDSQNASSSSLDLATVNKRLKTSSFRGGLVNTNQQLARRQVDVAKTTTTSEKKRFCKSSVNVAEELRRAIQEVSRPNRQLVASEIAQQREERRGKRLTMGGPPAKRRNPAVRSDTQVLATPMTNRHYDIYQQSTITTTTTAIITSTPSKTHVIQTPKSANEEVLATPPMALVQQTPGTKEMVDILQPGSSVKRPSPSQISPLKYRLVSDDILSPTTKPSNNILSSDGDRTDDDDDDDTQPVANGNGNHTPQSSCNNLFTTSILTSLAGQWE